MTLTRAHRGDGRYTLTCDGCKRSTTGADGMLTIELAAAATKRGWRITPKADTCPGCTRKAAAKTPAKRKR